MAAASGTENPAVTLSAVHRHLFAEPYSFEFVQAVRLLRLFYPDANGVGLFRDPRSEAVRFAVRPSLTFPPSEVFQLEQRPGLPPLMRVHFLGLVGPLGVLPLYYTEVVAERLAAKDSAISEFFQIFEHRLISLFYRAWQKYRFVVGYEQREADTFSQYLLDLIGLGTDGLENRQAVPDESLLFYAGLFAQQPRSAEALQLLLEDYFQVPVQVQQFLGAWYRLDPTSQCELDDFASESLELGFGTVVGDEVWDAQSRIRIVLGPLPLSRYLEFLPSGAAYRPLAALVRFFAGDEFDFEVQLILQKEQVPGCELGGTGPTAPQLGWLSWSKTRPLDHCPAETVLQL